MVFVHPASGGATETDIRIIVAAFTNLIALAAVSAQAAPFLPAKTFACEPGGCPPVEKVAQERGSGWHPVPYGERWGHCPSGRCFPTGGDNPYWAGARRELARLTGRVVGSVRAK
jgi:hypothetical protein